MPPDTPEAVGFLLRGWVCLEGDVVVALEAFAARLGQADAIGRRRLLDDPEQGLRAAGLRISRDPLRIVPAPGQARVSPCYTEAEWNDVLAAVRRAGLEAPRSLMAGAVPGALVEGPGGATIWQPMPGAPGRSVARLPDGDALAGGEPFGRLAGGGESDLHFHPVRTGDGKAVGHVVIPDVGGDEGLFLPLPGAAGEAKPVPVVVEPDGSLAAFWRDARAGLLLGPMEPPLTTIPRGVGTPVYDNEGRVIGHLATGSLGHDWFEPAEGHGGLSGEAKVVDGVVWVAGEAIGSTIRRPAARPVPATAPPRRPGPTAPRPSAPMAGPPAAPLGSDELATPSSDELWRLLERLHAQWEALQARKDIIRAQMRRLAEAGLWEPGRETARAEHDALDRQWKELHAQQKALLRRSRQVGEAWRRALKREDAAREATRRVRFLREGLGLARITGDAPAVALIELLQAQLGKGEFEAAASRWLWRKDPSLVGFLEFLMRSTRFHGVRGELARTRGALVALLTDPEAGRLLGASEEWLAAERKRLHDLIRMSFRRDFGSGERLERLGAGDLGRAIEQAIQLVRLASPAEREEARARLLALVARARMLIEVAEGAEAAQAEKRLIALADQLRPLLAALGTGAEARRLAGLIARAEEAAAQRRIFLGRGQEEGTRDLRRRAAAGFLLAGDRREALRILREIESDDPEARLLLLRLYDELERLRARPGGEEAESIARLLPGSGSAAERLAAARRELLERIASGDPREGATLAAALSLARMGAEARKAAEAALARIREAYREGGEPLPPAIRALELLAEIRDKLVGEAHREAREAFVRRLSTDPEAALALWFGPFGEDLSHEARRRLGGLVETALYRAIRHETRDPMRRTGLIRKLAALLFDMARRTASADRAIWGEDASAAIIIEELRRLRGNLEHYRRLLPDGEREALDAMLAAMHAMLAEVEAREEGRWKARSRRADVEYWRDLAVQELARGHVTTVAGILDRLDRLEGTTSPETLAGIRARLLRLARHLAPQKDALWPADRVALDRLIDRLAQAGREALAKKVAEAREAVVGRIANDVASPDHDRRAAAWAELWTRLEAYRHLRAAEILEGIGDGALPGTYERLHQMLYRAQKQLDAAHRRVQTTARARQGFSEAALAKDRVLLLHLAAERDAIEDVLLRLFPNRGFSDRGGARQARVRALTREINDPATAPGGPGIVVALLTSDLPRDHPWRGFTELWGRYLDQRRMQLLLEDPQTDPADGAKAYIALLDAERKRWQREREALAHGPFDLGRSREDLVRDRAREMRFRILPEIVARLAEAGEGGDPQKVMGLLASLLGREMRSALDAYLAYLDTPWSRQGLVRAYAVFWSDLVDPDYRWNQRVVLRRFQQQATRSWRLERALGKAAGMKPEALKKTAPADYAELERAGFIVKGRYVIPPGFRLRPGTVLDEAAAPSRLDEAVNAGALMEDLALVVIPGGAASRGSRALWEAIGRRMGERWLWLQVTGRLGTEAALFAGASRAGRAVLDPETLLDPRQWTTEALAGEIWHNFLVLGVLQGSAKFGDHLGREFLGPGPTALRPEQVWRMPLGRLRELSAAEIREALGTGLARILAETAGLTALGKAEQIATGREAPGLLENVILVLKLKALNLPLAPRLADTRPKSLDLHELRLAERLRVLDEMTRRDFVTPETAAAIRAWLIAVEKMPVEVRVELRRQMMSVLRARVGPAIDPLARAFVGRDPGFGPEVVDLSPASWRLGELLGSGGFGDVYRHPGDPGQVIKVVRGNAMKRGTPREKVTEAAVEAWRSAMREIAGTRLLKAAGIAHVAIRRVGAVDAVRPDGRPLRLPVLQKDLVGPGMEVNGEKVFWAMTLREWIDKLDWRRPNGAPKELPPHFQRAIAALVRQAARHGLFLGDLKPSNLFLYRVRPGVQFRVGVLEGDGVFRHDRVRELELFLESDVPEFPEAVAWELLDTMWAASSLSVGRAVPGVGYGGLTGWVSPKLLELMKSGLGGAPRFGPAEFLDLSPEAVLGRELGRILEDYEQALGLEKRIGEFARDPVERVALENLLWTYGGQWAKAVADYRAAKLPEAQMAALVRIRKRVVDALADEIVREVYGEERAAREKLWEAVGSESLTSDYDLSFKGERRELCLILFNERFRARWGAAELLGGVEGAGRLDTNAYTAPRYDVGPGGPQDVLTQEVAAQLAVRRQLDDAGWAEHRRRVLSGLEPAQRMELEAILDRAEAVWATFQRHILNRLEGAGSDARIRAANQVYEELMRRLIRLTNLHGAATDPAARARLEQAIREAQWQALFFAAEAYLTEAAIRHIVENTQKAGRRITAELLLSGPGDPARLIRPMDTHKARQSLLEQYAYLVHQIRDNAGFEKDPVKARKLAGKVAKYMVRLLDAARLAGIDLRGEAALVRRVVEVDANRGNPETLARILGGEGEAARLVNDARRLAERLVGRVYRVAPLAEGTPAPTPRSPIAAPASGPRSLERPVPVLDVHGVPTGWLAWPEEEDEGTIGLIPPGGLPSVTAEVLKNGVVLDPQRQIGGGGVARGSVGGGGGGLLGGVELPQAGTDTIPRVPPRPVHDASGRLVGHLWLNGLGREMLYAPDGRFLGEALARGGQVEMGGRIIGTLQKPPATGGPGRGAAQAGPSSGSAGQGVLAQRVIGRGGRNAGKVERDPTGRTWFTPLTQPDILTSPPLPASLSGDGAVIVGGVVVGRVAPVGVKGQEALSGSGPAAATPVAPGGLRASDSGTGRAVGSAPVWRELVGPGGRRIGRVQDLGNGKGYLEPVQIPGALVSPPPAVEIGSDGRVRLGGAAIGRLGRAVSPSEDSEASPAEPHSLPGEEVIGLDGAVIGRAEELPGGGWSFMPEAPPGMLVSPAPDLEVTPGGLVLVGGQAIGWLRGQGREAVPDLLFRWGRAVLLTVTVKHGEPRAETAGAAAEALEMPHSGPASAQPPRMALTTVPEAGGPPAPVPLPVPEATPKPEPEPAAGDYFRLMYGTVRVDVTGDEMTQTLVEPSDMPGMTIPAGTVILRAHRQGGQWIGQGLTRLPDCPGKDLWYDVKLGFDAPDPGEASSMSIWMGIPVATGDACNWSPSGQFTGPYSGQRVPAPVAPGNAAAASDDAAEGRGAATASPTPAPEDPLEAASALLAYAADAEGEDDGARCAPVRRMIEELIAAMEAIQTSLGQISTAGSGVVDPTAMIREMQTLQAGYRNALDGLTRSLRQCLQAAGHSPP